MDRDELNEPLATEAVRAPTKEQVWEAMKRAWQKEALYWDRVGLSIARDYLGHLPNLHELHTLARYVIKPAEEGQTGIKREFKWDGRIIATVTLLPAPPASGTALHVPDDPFTYSLQRHYTSDQRGALALMSEQEYYEWANRETGVDHGQL